ncbi:hypothetical protein [Nakamurella leprariae]|uniref:Uncharacterized protein n=1 Tax=Nakamurella leprariae TaxID=2803911 RepID=A0A938YCG3_9ACTN|nr:hypothetical protein [Nakamurella leprariae]MBM9467284.1 hypothetical protein [Nakamurella leprariae]
MTGPSELTAQERAMRAVTSCADRGPAPAPEGMLVEERERSLASIRQRAERWRRIAGTGMATIAQDDALFLLAELDAVTAERDDARRLSVGYRTEARAKAATVKTVAANLDRIRRVYDAAVTYIGWRSTDTLHALEAAVNVDAARASVPVTEPAPAADAVERVARIIARESLDVHGVDEATQQAINDRRWPNYADVAATIVAALDDPAPASEPIGYVAVERLTGYVMVLPTDADTAPIPAAFSSYSADLLARPRLDVRPVVCALVPVTDQEADRG